MGSIKHNMGIQTLVSEIGFETVKYFETTIGTSATTISIDPPARRIILRNTSTSAPVYLRVNGGAATTSVGLIPGEDIKVPAQGIFTMDYDTINEVSFIALENVFIEAMLGFK